MCWKIQSIESKQQPRAAYRTSSIFLNADTAARARFGCEVLQSACFNILSATCLQISPSLFPLSDHITRSWGVWSKVTSGTENCAAKRTQRFRNIRIVCHQHHTFASARILAIGTSNLLATLLFHKRPAQRLTTANSMRGSYFMRDFFASAIASSPAKNCCMSNGSRELQSG